MRLDTGSVSDVDVRFEVLGPICIVRGDRRVQMRAARQRVILAALLLESNHMVSSETLIDAVWDEAPPVTAASQVHICMSAIRTVLRDFGVADLIVTEPKGYLIRIDDEWLDLRRFNRLSAEAMRLAERDSLVEAASMQRQALELWRGPALCGVSSTIITSRAVRLDEERLLASERCVDWELRLGRHRELIGELVERVAAHPMRERSRAQLMLALYRSGRQAEALQTFRSARQALVDQLGLEPGEELWRLESLILADDPQLQLGIQEEPVRLAAPAQVCQLPASTDDFVDHCELVRGLTAQLVGSTGVGTVPTLRTEPPVSAVSVVVLAGMAGVGKSVLAVHLAHAVAAARFTDGQLYADLTDGMNCAPSSVLSRFLRALGVSSEAIPESLAERAELYRSLLAGRGLLVVLDGAVSEEQVRPLLPGSASCAVLITSRFRLAGLAGAHLVDVPPFGDRQAAELLSRIAGAERIAPHPHLVTDLTNLVGGLPLALRVSGARLRARPHWTLRQLLDRLIDERRRLDELAYGDVNVRLPLSAAYSTVPDRARFMLGLLSGFANSGFPGWLAAAALDVDESEAVELLEQQVEVQLVEVLAGTSRFRIHPLVRVLAAEQAAAEPRRYRVAALARMCGGWLWLAERAHQSAFGGRSAFYGSTNRWRPAVLPEPERDLAVGLDLDRANLCAAVSLAAAAGLDELCWELAVTLAPLFAARGRLDEWEQTHRAALTAVRNSGNRRGETALLCSLGALHVRRGETDKSCAVLAPALSTFADLDDRRAAPSRSAPSLP